MKKQKTDLQEAGVRCHARRQLVKFLALSPLAACGAGMLRSAFADEVADESGRAIPVGSERDSAADDIIARARDAKNVFQMEAAAREKLTPDLYHFVADGSDDMKTVRANRRAFDDLQIRARRLVDVSHIDTSVVVLGQTMQTPIILAPAGAQQYLNPEGEIATARAAAGRKHLLIAATLSNFSIGEIAAAGRGPLWFQLYVSRDRSVTRQLLRRAEDAGAGVVALSVDSATRGNQERRMNFDSFGADGKRLQMGNFKGLQGKVSIGDPSITWDYVDWLKKNTQMKVVLKGIVTHEDARLSVDRGADGIIVSNHGGRQEESNRATIECLPEIVAEVRGRIPVMIDGGFRRGTDVFKALALGARAVCIGRPYLWGLAAFGAPGVRRVLRLMRLELERIMKLAGTPAIHDITPDFVKRRECAV